MKNIVKLMLQYYGKGSSHTYYVYTYLSDIGQNTEADRNHLKAPNGLTHSLQVLPLYLCRLFHDWIR